MTGGSSSASWAARRVFHLLGPRIIDVKERLRLLVSGLDQPGGGGRLLQGPRHDHGDVLAVVDDPVVLLEPWVMPTRRLNLNKTPGLQLMQDVPYQDHSLGKLVDPENRG